eukprot:CAMPEP_0172523994 /NCGR_PEP_ID=MMETSP1066-20121228/293952_1 /TAXON_ID=671091 /ORGANISM="Coscinodiscus wailesii, Strain CCMP2513" /LENGTH=212 /DNA_ID=CAMNT_0013307095 /DNA_START=321 /DNA_END=959 /DNA_ORIENTATION=-
MTSHLRVRIMSLLMEFIEPCLMLRVQQDQNEISSEKNQAKYNERAVLWSLDRMRDLIRPPEETFIPELDALLSATSEHDPLIHEECLQSALWSTIQETEKRIAISLLGDGGVDNVHAKTMTSLVEDERLKLEQVLSLLDERSADGGGSQKLLKLSEEDEWASFPWKWLDEIRLDRTECSRPERQEKQNLAIKASPFLGQMRDFLERQIEKDE